MATPYTIAVAGKGGVGKTTTCGMIIDYLCNKKNGPVLVVDADANANLNEVLGVEVETSLGAIREEMAQAELKGTIPAGMTKADYADFKFSSAIIEEVETDDPVAYVRARLQGRIDELTVHERPDGVTIYAVCDGLCHEFGFTI